MAFIGVRGRRREGCDVSSVPLCSMNMVQRPGVLEISRYSVLYYCLRNTPMEVYKL